MNAIILVEKLLYLSRKYFYSIDLTILLQRQHFLLTLPHRRRIIMVEKHCQQVTRKRVFFPKAPENKET